MSLEDLVNLRTSVQDEFLKIDVEWCVEDMITKIEEDAERTPRRGARRLFEDGGEADAATVARHERCRYSTDPEVHNDAAQRTSSNLSQACLSNLRNARLSGSSAPALSKSSMANAYLPLLCRVIPLR